MQRWDNSAAWGVANCERHHLFCDDTVDQRDRDDAHAVRHSDTSHSHKTNKLITSYLTCNTIYVLHGRNICTGGRPTPSIMISADIGSDWQWISLTRHQVLSTNLNFAGSLHWNWAELFRIIVNTIIGTHSTHGRHRCQALQQFVTSNRITNNLSKFCSNNLLNFCHKMQRKRESV